MSGKVSTGDKARVFEGVVPPAGKNAIRPTFIINGRTVTGGRNADGEQQGPIRVTFERLEQA